MKQIRVGQVVYEGGKPIVERIHGIWYRTVKHTQYDEKVPIDQEFQCKFDSIPDALLSPVTEGELAIMNQVSESLYGSTPSESLYGFTPAEKQKLLQDVEVGVLGGLRKYGPYQPEAEERNLQVRAAKEARNLIVYLAMLAIQPGANVGTLRGLIKAAARIWLSLVL